MPLILKSTLVARSPIQRVSSVVTLTMGDCAENHKGMEILGTLAAEGFKREDLLTTQGRFAAAGAETVLYDLDDEKSASVLVIRNGVSVLMGSKDKLFEEQAILRFDTKAFMYGRVVNKKARWNLCFAEEGHGPVYEEGKGTVIPYKEVPRTAALVAALPTWFGPKAADLKTEGNYYYDVTKCGIGFHGDSERRKVIAARLGASLPLHFQWYQASKPIGERIVIPLEDGDMYVMSEKAVGTDWKKKKIKTLRHATGCEAFVGLKL
jgi:hypothetical protein